MRDDQVETTKNMTTSSINFWEEAWALLSRFPVVTGGGTWWDSVDVSSSIQFGGVPNMAVPQNHTMVLQYENSWLNSWFFIDEDWMWGTMT